MTTEERLQYELRALQSYLRNVLPLTPLPPDDLILSPNSLAIQSAISGVENQLLKLERDEKLRRKFASTSSSSSSSTNENENGGDNKSNNTSIHDSGNVMKTTSSTRDREDIMDGEYVKMTKEDAAAAASTTTETRAAAVDSDDTKMDDDWEEAGNIKHNDDHQKDDSFVLHENSHVQNPNYNSEDENGQEQYFRTLASATVAKIAASKLQVTTPLGALGLALHVALLIMGGKRLGGTNVGDDELRCTGVPSPDDGNGSKGGFAPPVRELPSGVLVPESWEEFALSKTTMSNDPDEKEIAQKIAFRYWRGSGGCQGGGMLGRGVPSTVYLSLQLLPSTAPEGMAIVHVTFGPRQVVQTAGQASQSQLTIKLGTHVNLDGFKTAKKTSTTTTISPSLFYISLSELLSQFDATFGHVLSPKDVESTAESNNVQLLEATKSLPPPEEKRKALDMDGGAAVHPTAMPTVRPLAQILEADDAMKTRRHGGDFEGDLLPGGPLQPPFGIEDNTTTIPPGSQVGPDHPIFDRTFGDDAYYDYDEDYRYNGGGMGGRDGFGLPGLPSGMGMRPRFDPFGPPGGPTEPGRGRGRFSGRGVGRGRAGRGGRGMPPPPGGFGDPNPDHLSPPGSGYFS